MTGITQITVEGVDYHFKLTKRAIAKWEGKGKDRSRHKISELSQNDDMALTVEGFNEGAKLTGSNKTYTVDELYDLDAKYDLIDKLKAQLLIDNEKKHQALQEG